MTEMVTGVDLIAEQIRAAQGEVLRYKQEDIQLKVSYCVITRVSMANTASLKLGTQANHDLRFEILCPVHMAS